MAVVKGLLGKKIGMTQVFQENRAIPVTVISAGPCYVMAVKRREIDGYDAIKIGYEQVKPKKRRLTKPRLGEFNKLKIKPLKDVREIRIEDGSVLDNYKVGEELKVNIFKQGEFLDVTSYSKGKGFQGGVKRWGWSIGPKSHGSRSHRSIGSIGQSSSPSRVFKGLHMAGHMGDDKVTIQNLEIVDLNLENNLILLKGGIPGARNSMVILRSAKKKSSEFFKPEEQENVKEERKDKNIGEEVSGKAEELAEAEEGQVAQEDVVIKSQEEQESIKGQKTEEDLDNNKKEETGRPKKIEQGLKDSEKDNEED